MKIRLNTKDHYLALPYRKKCNIHIPSRFQYLRSEMKPACVYTSAIPWKEKAEFFMQPRVQLFSYEFPVSFRFRKDNKHQSSPQLDLNQQQISQHRRCP